MMTTSRRGALAFALGAVLGLAASGAAQTSADLSALAFLLGDWDAVGLPRGDSGAFNFSLAVQDRIIVRTNYSKTAARDGRPASRHDDLMVIFVERGTIKADYFDSEQHVIHYNVQRRGPRDIVFISEPNAPEPRYRLTYSLAADGILKGSFELAAAESADDFKPLFSWSARKLK